MFCNGAMIVRTSFATRKAYFAGSNSGCAWQAISALTCNGGNAGSRVGDTGSCRGTTV
jgi:hypothetical protein